MATTRELFHQYAQQPTADIKAKRFEDWRRENAEKTDARTVQPIVNEEAEIRRKLGFDLVWNR